MSVMADRQGHGLGPGQSARLPAMTEPDLASDRAGSLSLESRLGLTRLYAWRISAMSSVISTVPEFLRLATVSDPDLRRRLWVEQYEQSFPTVFASYYAGWGSTSRRVDAADRAPQWALRVAAREDRLRSAVEQARKQLEEKGFGRVEFDTVLMVGVETSNGWATLLDGQPTLFLALEMMNDDVGDEVVAIHEAMHAVHLALLGPDRQWSGTFVHDFAAEGLAVAASRIIHPGLSDSEYLWFTTGYEDWIDDCQRQRAAIRSTICSLADAGEDDETVSGLLTMHERADLLPARCGYWLADQMTQDWMSSGKALLDIATMSTHEVSANVTAWLADANYASSP